MAARRRVRNVRDAPERGEPAVVVRGLATVDVHGKRLAAFADMLSRALHAVAEPGATAFPATHLDRQCQRALTIAPAHVDSVEILRGQDALLDRLAYPSQRGRRAHGVDAEPVTRVVTG